MRIAVMGTGGVGGYFGGTARPKSGEDVTFIARGKHLEAMQRDGLRVQSVHGDFAIPQVQGPRIQPQAVGPVDLVIFATKTYQLDDGGRGDEAPARSRDRRRAAAQWRGRGRTYGGDCRGRACVGWAVLRRQHGRRDRA